MKPVAARNLRPSCAAALGHAKVKLTAARTSVLCSARPGQPLSQGEPRDVVRRTSSISGLKHFRRRRPY